MSTIIPWEDGYVQLFNGTYRGIEMKLSIAFMGISREPVMEIGAGKEKTRTFLRSGLSKVILVAAIGAPPSFCRVNQFGNVPQIALY